MTIFFVADLHLAEPDDTRTRLWLHFLNSYASAMSALYILGDFVEFWIGDDALSTHPLAEVLKATRALSCPVYFVVGNRDFLVGARFASYIGATLLPEPFVLTVAKERFLLLHGDRLCRADVAHQRFRTVTGWHWLQWCWQRLPLTYRQKIGQKMRQKSLNRQKQAPHSYAPVDTAYAEDLTRRFGCQHMIHGHIHVPGMHPLSEGWRFVLSDWHESAVVGVLEEEGRFRLERITCS